jgi:hypothetical protein
MLAFKLGVEIDPRAHFGSLTLTCAQGHRLRCSRTQKSAHVPYALALVKALAM